ncbi:MAG: prolipoprotein diacylglyceryl transferase family protein [Chloroflexales bacterium]
MYPLIELGPLRLSSGGLLLLAAAYLWTWRVARVARRQGGAALAAHAEACTLPALVGALLGGGLWFGLFSLDRYGPSPGLFVALRLADLAWPGALLGGTLVGWGWCRRRGADPRAMADAAALGLPLALAVASVGLLLSGDAFGVPTDLPWGVPLFGTQRHPTQIYSALAALLVGAALSAAQHVATSERPLAPGGLAARFLVLHGLSLLLIEALRADSLTIAAGLRVTQIAGLTLIITGLFWLRAMAAPGAPRTRLVERCDGQGD